MADPVVARRNPGRPTKFSAGEIALARRMLARRNTTIADVAAAFGVARLTIYRVLGLGAWGKAAAGG